jgi:hypothetical protein
MPIGNAPPLAAIKAAYTLGYTSDNSVFDLTVLFLFHLDIEQVILD